MYVSIHLTNQWNLTFDNAYIFCLFCPIFSSGIDEMTKYTNFRAYIVSIISETIAVHLQQTD